MTSSRPAATAAPESPLPVVRRLTGYWKMEAANVLVLPAAALLWLIWMEVPARALVDPALILSIVACATLLALGALYWRAALHRALGRRSTMQQLVPVLAALQAPCLWACIAVVAALPVSVLLGGAGWQPVHTASAVVGGLAVLEYVNYYRIQLNHFDNAADWRRLLAGRGFQPAHMARDIARWRARQRQEG